MRDFGSLGSGIAKRAKAVSQNAAEKVSQTYDDYRRGDSNGDATSPVDSTDEASSAEVAAEARRLRALIERNRPNPGPVVGRWSIGVGDMLAEHPRMPEQLKDLARRLDRYGGLAITEDTVAFDGNVVDWAAVTEIRTRNIVDFLLSDAVNQQVGNLPLPWFPGRQKLLDLISKGLLTLLLATAKKQLERPDIDVQIPALIEYTADGQPRQQLNPGLLAALVLVDPAVSECLRATAQARQIEVLPADDEAFQTVEQRAERLREKVAQLKSRFAATPELA